MAHREKQSFMYGSRFDWLHPRRCAMCNERLSMQDSVICPACNVGLMRTNFVQHPQHNEMAQLFWHSVPIEKAVAWLFHHSRTLSAQAVYGMKYRRKTEVAFFLGEMMAAELQTTSFFNDISFLYPVPLALEREKQRGYNQSLAIAQGVSAVTGINIIDDLVTRVHFSESQTHLTRNEREANVARSFQLVKTQACVAKNQHILLIDDVCTTGATLSALARTLAMVQGVRMSALVLAFAGTHHGTADDLWTLDSQNVVFFD